MAPEFYFPFHSFFIICLISSLIIDCTLPVNEKMNTVRALYPSVIIPLISSHYFANRVGAYRIFVVSVCPFVWYAAVHILKFQYKTLVTSALITCRTTSFTIFQYLQLCNQTIWQFFPCNKLSFGKICRKKRNILCASKVCAYKVCAYKVCVSKVCASKVCVYKVCIGQVCFALIPYVLCSFER